MDIELVDDQKINAREPAGLLVARPALYIAIILAVIMGAYAYKLRTEGIFSCPADGYAATWYLSYCHTPGYGDYEHGAFWFGLEPSLQDSVAHADVLFLGNSRMQLALSTATTADWFAAASARHYLMGFGYGENVAFARELLRKFKPQAKVYVINIDRFFESFETVPAKTVLRDQAAPLRYEVKRLWQFVHRPICRALPAACGEQYVIFRSRDTGAYRVSGLGQFQSEAVSYDTTPDPTAIDNAVATGRQFLSDLPVERECIILTMTPTVGTKTTTARALAAALGFELLAPDVEALQTYDGSHLNGPSAERWSAAFLQAAAPRIGTCLGKSTGSSR